MKKIKLSLMILILSSFSVFSQNPTVVNGVATYNTSTTIGAQFAVPDTWNKIIIKKNVTINGNFIIQGSNRDFSIVGEDWNTSILDNSITTYEKGNRSLCNIRFENHGNLKLSKFTSLNPANFHITGWGPMVLDSMRIIENRRRTSTDAAHSTKGLVILNSYISTYDDVLYVGECSLIQNTTVMHNTNGAPIQVSWGGNADNMYTKVVNCTFIDNESNGQYSHGVVGWAQKNDPGIQTAKVEFVNSNWITGNGKIACEQFYSIGNNGNTVTDGKVLQIGGLCDWATTIRQRNGSNGVVLTQNCLSTLNNVPPTVSLSATPVTATAPATIGLTATAADANGTVSNVKFYNGTTLLATDNTAPFEFNWTNVTTGSYTLTAKATDNEGAFTTSSVVTVIVSDLGLQPTDIGDLSVEIVACNEVILAWDDVQNETGYRVRRKLKTEVTYVNIADLPANKTSYTDVTVLPNTSYNYVVRPLKDGVALANSNLVEILVPRCTITKLDEEKSELYEGFYPNPVNDRLHLSKNQEWSIFTLQGNLLKQGDSKDIDVSELPQGAYLLKTDTYHHFIKQ